MYILPLYKLSIFWKIDFPICGAQKCFPWESLIRGERYWVKVFAQRVPPPLHIHPLEIEISDFHNILAIFYRHGQNPEWWLLNRVCIMIPSGIHTFVMLRHVMVFSANSRNDFSNWWFLGSILNMNTGSKFEISFSFIEQNQIFSVVLKQDIQLFSNLLTDFNFMQYWRIILS